MYCYKGRLCTAFWKKKKKDNFTSLRTLLHVFLLFNIPRYLFLTVIGGANSLVSNSYDGLVLLQSSPLRRDYQLKI